MSLYTALKIAPLSKPTEQLSMTLKTPPAISFNDDVLVTQEQAADLLQISAATLQKWRSTGENNLPFVKIGRNARYRTSALKAFVELHTKQEVPQ
jgi:excisionase family DNA binding protein